MQKLSGVILFLVLALVILQIMTLRTLSNDEKRLSVLEKRVEALQSLGKPAMPATVPSQGQ